jgi:hypothetical protein
MAGSHLPFENGQALVESSQIESRRIPEKERSLKTLCECRRWFRLPIKPPLSSEKHYPLQQNRSGLNHLESQNEEKEVVIESRVLPVRDDASKSAIHTTPFDQPNSWANLSTRREPVGNSAFLFGLSCINLL